MASSSFEAGAASLLSSIVMLRCNHGSELELPFMDKDVVKKQVRAKLSQLPADIGRHMTLKKLHLKENGWSVLLFFEPIEEAMRAEVLEILKTWGGSNGSARFLSAEESATQTMMDMRLKGEKRTSSTSLGDLERTTSLLSLCLSLQGTLVHGSGPVSKAQRRNSSLALQCFNRVQAHTAKSLNGSSEPKVQNEDGVTDGESNV